MGWMRLWLASGVAVGHGAPAPGPFWFDPGAAVLGFYVLSGYTMAMVLERRYQGRIPDFYFNRVLRIYPAYLAVLGLVLLHGLYCALRLALMFGPFQGYFIQGLRPGLAARAYIVLSQLFILGQESAHLFAVGKSGGLHWAPQAYYYGNALWRFFFIPQAWTLGVELVFYILAPLWVRSGSRALALVFASGLALRLGLDLSGLQGAYPWIGRILPLELSVFCGGILAWRLARGGGAAWNRGALALLAGVILLSGFAPPAAQRSVLPLAMLALLPALGSFRPGRLSVLAGELSYPFYLCHLFVFSVFATPGWPGGGEHAGLFVLPACLLLSAALHFGVERPIRRLRRGPEAAPSALESGAKSH